MTKRALILEAAARLFGEHGYRGATTRRIALEAGVSEVTLFRQFGTKDALLREALGPSSRRLQVAPLPETPGNVQRELVGWCAAYLRQLRAARKVIRKSLGEFVDRPRVARRAAALPTAATRMLREYLERASRQRALPAEFDVTAAATVLTGVLFADAIGRDLMPGEFPEPADDAHKLYVRFVFGRTLHEASAGRKPKATVTATPTPVAADRTEPAGRSPKVVSRTNTSADRRRSSPTRTTVFDRRRSAGSTLGTLEPPARSRRGRGRG
jgi:AcrR family transcriptional regulator